MAEDPELDDLLSSVETGANQAEKDDADLSSLLDSALKDFGPSQTEGTAAETAADRDGNHVSSAASENGFPNLQDLLKGGLRARI